MKYFTKEWYENGCNITASLSEYTEYYENNKNNYPKGYCGISFHDSHILKVRKNDCGDFFAEFLIDSDKQIIIMQLKNAHITESCELENKICLAEELYIKENGYDLHLLLCDECNSLYYFTASCKDIILTTPRAISIRTLAYYCIPGSPYYEDDFVYNAFSRKITRKNHTVSAPDCFPLPKMEASDLLYEYLQSLKNKKLTSYLALFATDINARRYAEREICFIFNNQMKRVCESREFNNFCFARLKPLVELWSKKTGVIADYEFETQGGKNISEQLISDDNFYIPTDGIIISDCIFLCTQKNMFLNKKTYITKEIKSLCKADKQFIKLPYISDDDIMKLFFETNRFNDDEKDLKNHKLLNKYSAFSRQYLSNILIKWCRKNQISYICDK